MSRLPGSGHHCRESRGQRRGIRTISGLGAITDCDILCLDLPHLKALTHRQPLHSSPRSRFLLIATRARLVAERDIVPVYLIDIIFVNLASDDDSLLGGELPHVNFM